MNTRKRDDFGGPLIKDETAQKLLSDARVFKSKIDIMHDIDKREGLFFLCCLL